MIINCVLDIKIKMNYVKSPINCFFSITLTSLNLHFEKEGVVRVVKKERENVFIKLLMWWTSRITIMTTFLSIMAISWTATSTSIILS